MLRTAILSEIAIENGLLDGDSAWVFVVQHQSEAPDQPFERWATGKGLMSGRESAELLRLLDESTFHCVKCETSSEGRSLLAGRHLSCSHCGGVAIKRVFTPPRRSGHTTRKLPPGSEMATAAAPDGLYPAQALTAAPADPADDIRVVPLIGKLGNDNCVRFEQELRALQDDGVRRIIIDLARCDSINAAGLAALRRVADSLSQSSGRLVMAAMPPQVRTMLDMFDAAGVFETANSTPGARRLLDPGQAHRADGGRIGGNREIHQHNSVFR